MDYGQLLSRAWDVVWNNKWLVVLGLVVALSSGGSNGGSRFNYSGNNFGKTWRSSSARRCPSPG
jgi:hypothetical protein